MQQRTVSARRLRVWWDDWSLVVTGAKRQYRAPARFGLLNREQFPVPVLVYTTRNRVRRAKLVVLEEQFEQPLMALSLADIHAEGFADISEFRAYWCQRHQRGVDPMGRVHVHVLRPLLPDDGQRLGEHLLDYLYELNAQTYPEAFRA